MAQYTKIHLSQMFPEVLNPDKGWRCVDVAKAKEHVFDWPMAAYPGVVIRVYSSVAKSTALGRRLGSDAIRVCAVDTVSNKGVASATRVHRVEGWRENLKGRILDVLKLTRKRMSAKEEFGHWTRPVAPMEKKPVLTAADFLPTIPAFKFKKTRTWWFRLRLCSDEAFALHALMVVYGLQTADEQKTQSTVLHNGVGFTGTDAEILSSFSEQLEKKQDSYGGDARLSPKQTALVLKKMPKYVKQIIARFEGEAVKA